MYHATRSTYRPNPHLISTAPWWARSHSTGNGRRGEGSAGSHALVGGHLAAVAQAHASWTHSQEGSAPHSPGVTFLPRFGGSRAEAASLLRLD